MTLLQRSIMKDLNSYKSNNKFDVNRFRKSFNLENIIFFDSSAATLLPKEVIKNTTEFIYKFPLSSFRSIYSFPMENIINKTKQEILFNFININERENFEIFFSSNASDVVFRLVIMYMQHNVQKDDVVLVSKNSHHTLSGILVYLKNKCHVNWLEERENFDSKKVKYLFLQHISNIDGTCNINIDYRKHFPNSKIILDLNQSFGFLNKELFSKCDFLFFSSHKYFAFTGTGVLISRKGILKNISFPSGGNIYKIENDFSIKFSRDTLELGTLNSVSILSIYNSINFLNKFSFQREYLINLNNYFVNKIKEKNYPKHLVFLNPKRNQKPTFSFFSRHIHSHDLSDELFSNKIYVRSGYQCCSTCIKQTVTRISLSLYNTYEEIDYFFSILKNING